MSEQLSTDIQQSEQRRSKTKKVVAVAALTAVTAVAGVGIVAYKAGERNSFTPATAEALTDGLNGQDHVVRGAVVEVGSQIPLGDNSPVEGAVAIINPIKVGEDTYAYVHPGTQSGKAKIVEFHYDGPLEASPIGGYSDAYAHQVVTDVALTYTTYANTEDGPRLRYYSVIMGNQSGDQDDMVNIQSGVDQIERDREISEQYGQMSEARVGDLEYYGK